MAKLKLQQVTGSQKRYTNLNLSTGSFLFSRYKLKENIGALKIKLARADEASFDLAFEAKSQHSLKDP